MDYFDYNSWKSQHLRGYTTTKTSVDIWAQLQREMAQGFNNGLLDRNMIEVEKIEKLLKQNVLLLLL